MSIKTDNQSFFLSPPKLFISILLSKLPAKDTMCTQALMGVIVFGKRCAAPVTTDNSDVTVHWYAFQVYVCITATKWGGKPLE